MNHWLQFRWPEGGRGRGTRHRLAAAVAAIILAAAMGAASLVAAKDFVILQGTEPITFDPTQFATGNQVFLHQLYDALVVLDPDGLPAPSLALSWARSDDGLTVRFELREAVFHSGRPIEAEDVVFTLQRYLDPQVGANLRQRLQTITAVRAVDSRTVEMDLSSPTPGLFALLSNVFIQDRDGVANLASEAAGSGRFVLSEFEPGVSFTMTRFGGHWDAEATTAENLIVRIVPDQQTAAALLRTGDADVFLFANALTADGLVGAADVQVFEPNAAPMTIYLMVNTSRPPLDDVLVRQALQRSIDRVAIGEIAFAGRGMPTCQPWFSGHWAHDPSLEESCSFDLDLARDLLQRSGVSNVTISVNTSVDSYSPGSTAIAQILQQALAQIGVTLTIQNYEQARARELLLASDFDLLIHQYNEGGSDPQFIMPSALFGPGGRAMFTSPEYEVLMASASNTLEQADRRAIYADIARVIVDAAFIMPIVHRLPTVPMADDVDGFAIDVSGFPLLSRLTRAD